MAILSDRTISEYVEKGYLIGEGFDPLCLTPNGYDLRIDKLRLMEGKEDLEEGIVPPASPFFVSTIERMAMPDNVGGQMWIRSSYARKGVLGSFGFIDAGFNGNLTLSFFNGSTNPLEIRRGDRIAQVVFMLLTSESDVSYEGRSGNYQHSKGITLS